MNIAEVGAIEALLDYLSTLSPMEGAGFLILLALCIRLVRGSSIKELIGLKNDIVRGHEFRRAMDEVNGRLDRHFKVVEDVREDIGQLNERVAKLEIQIEQYRK